ncbi:MAG: cytochrome C biosynthesis protein, partial [Flavobacterium sp.]|nr:cytochrome C biosynthesis protein [Flavobacterium sp.]
EMGKNYFGLKNYEKSFSSYEKAAQIEPKNKWFWAGMYDVSYQIKNYNQAIIAVNKLIEFNESYKDDLVSLYMYTQQFDKALVLINELNEKVGKSDRREMYKTQILAQGKFQNDEINNLIAQIKLNPKEEANYVALIKLYSENNESEKEAEITKKLETEIPDSDFAQIGLFKFYLDKNEAQKAINAMNVVLANAQIDSKIKHRVLNEFLLFVDKNPQYSSDLDKAIAYFDKDTTVNVGKEIGKFYHSKKLWTKAAFYYEQVLKNSSGEDIETNMLLLQTYVETKQFDIVSKKAATLVEIYPSQPQFYYFSGLANNQLKHYKKAIEMLEMGMDYVIDDVQLETNFNLQLGEAFNGLGDFKKKEYYFAKANQLLKTKK